MSGMTERRLKWCKMAEKKEFGLELQGSRRTDLMDRPTGKHKKGIVTRNRAR